MSKKKRRVVLDDYKRSKAAEGGIIIVADGREWEIPPPQLWPDEVAEASAATDNPAAAQVRAARALLGDDYDAFVEAGGNAAIVWGIIADELGADVPESSASSSS